MIGQYLRLIAICEGVDIADMSVDDFLSGGFEDAAAQATHKSGRHKRPLLASKLR